MEKGPGPNDTEVFANVAQALLPKVTKWVGCPPAGTESEELAQELVRMLDNTFERDAYRMTRFLDDAGWEADERLVEILREVPWLLNKYRGLRGTAT